MLLADALSRCPSRASGEIKLDMRVDYIAFSKTWIAKLKDTTREDPILGTVYQLTQQGWPQQRRHTPRMARAYWDFRDQLSTDEGLLLMGPRIVIPSCLREAYLQRLHQGHLSATKIQQNARQHLYWPGLDADIADYTRRCKECIRRSQPPKEPLQAHEVPQEPWERIAMDYFYMNGRLYILICDYFSKFPFLFQVKTTSFANLKDHLEELFSVEGIPDEIMSDNGDPFNGKEFSSYLTGLGIRHTTSSPNYPRSNGFIERQIQTVKRLIEKANSSGRSHQEALTGLRAQPLGDGLPSPSEILHGRSLVTRKASPVDLTVVRQSLIALQAKYTKSHDKARRSKTQRTLVIGEEVYFLSGKNEWQIGIVTGTTDTRRSYNILTDEGTSLRRNRSHLKPRCHDIPIISRTLPSRTSTPSQSEITGKPLPGTQHPPKVKYSYNNKQNISFQDQYEQHPPKAKYFPNNNVPKLVIRRVGDTAYDSYIAETLYPLKSAIKPRKQTRFAGDPVTSVKTILARRTRSHPPKWTIEAEDPDLLIPLELSQSRADSDLNQDLGGDLSVVSPRESHQSEETLPTVPLGQFQAHRSDNTTTTCIAHSQHETPSQSEINSTITKNIVENIVTSQNATPSQREIFSETGTGTTSSEDVTHSDGDTPEEHLHQTGSQSDNEETSESRESATPSQSEIFSGYNNSSNNNSDCETATSSQSEITSEYDASSEPSSREASNPSSPESGNLSVRTVYSLTPEMAIIHRTMHDAIHAVREQQGRAMRRSLLNQQKAIAASKFQCNIQIKRTSTPEHPPMSNVPPRRARARSEKANGVTSGSSEESDSEPQTSRMARFQALKMRFETPTKSEEESQYHRTFKRQRLFRKTSSQSATDCPSKEYRTPGPS